MTTTIRRWAFAAALALCAGWAFAARATDTPTDFIDTQIAAHPGKTGVYVLDTGVEALLARAWLVENARQSIEVQYFIWSSDNIGTLAAEALLRAAGRGVRVRVIVDDLLIDAPDQALLALARDADIVVLSVKPQMLRFVFRDLCGKLRKDALVLSIIAGAPQA